MATFKIHKNGNFTPQKPGTMAIGSNVSFDVEGGETKTVYVYKEHNQEWRLNATLFGRDAISSAQGGTIQQNTSGEHFRLSLSENGPGGNDGELQVSETTFHASSCGDIGPQNTQNLPTGTVVNFILNGLGNPYNKLFFSVEGFFGPNIVSPVSIPRVLTVAAQTGTACEFWVNPPKQERPNLTGSAGSIKVGNGP
jgi:hypothetical protein